MGQDLCTAVLGGQPELSLDTLEAAHRSNRDAVDYEIIRCLVRQVGKQLLSIGYNRDVFVRPAKSRADSYCGEGGIPCAFAPVTMARAIRIKVKSFFIAVGI